MIFLKIDKEEQILTQTVTSSFSCRERVLMVILTYIFIMVHLETFGWLKAALILICLLPVDQCLSLVTRMTTLENAVEDCNLKK